MDICSSRAAKDASLQLGGVEMVVESTSGDNMKFETYLAEIEAAIREHDTANEITLSYTDGSYNRTFDGESTWRLGKMGARVVRGATPLQSVIQWLDGANVDHSSKAVIGESTAVIAARQIVGKLKRGM
jgi:hypothetical protein